MTRRKSELSSTTVRFHAGSRQQKLAEVVPEKKSCHCKQECQAAKAPDTPSSLKLFQVKTNLGCGEKIAAPGIVRHRPGPYLVAALAGVPSFVGKTKRLRHQPIGPQLPRREQALERQFESIIFPIIWEAGYTFFTTPAAHFPSKNSSCYSSRTEVMISTNPSSLTTTARQG